MNQELWAGETDETPPEHRKKQCYGTPPNIKAAAEAYIWGGPLEDWHDAKLFDPCPWNPTQDGLEINWGRHVFLNPPYGKKMPQKWVDKAIEEFESGRTDVIIWLVNYANSRACSEIARRSCGFIHITGGRVSFIDPVTKRPRTSNDRDSALYIWDRDGLDVRSARVFSELGEIFEKK